MSVPIRLNVSRKELEAIQSETQTEYAHSDDTIKSGDCVIFHCGSDFCVTIVVNVQHQDGAASLAIERIDLPL